MPTELLNLAHHNAFLLVMIVPNFATTFDFACYPASSMPLELKPIDIYLGVSLAPHVRGGAGPPAKRYPFAVRLSTLVIL